MPPWPSNPSEWQRQMTEVFRELERVLAPGGYVAFEVGDVRGGNVLLESLVVPAAAVAGLVPRMVLIHDQKFTKTSHCWGIENRKKGTNTNRVVVLEKCRGARHRSALAYGCCQVDEKRA